MNSQAERDVARGDWDCHPRFVGRTSPFRYRLHVQGVLDVFHLIHVCLHETSGFLALQQYDRLKAFRRDGVASGQCHLDSEWA